ncbi:serine/threonine protein kinase [Candidatus Obscuribacterales bacterium]|nr:serine/threonine protein kinase [Candidatus Obscuribacterales bacterium]
MSNSARWLPGLNKAQWLIWISTIACMLYSKQTCSIMMIVMLFLAAEDWKTRAAQFRERAHLYMLVLSGALLASAWQRPIAVIAVYMTLSWIHLHFQKKAMANRDYAWFCEHLLSLSALRMHCLAIFVAVCSYSYHEFTALLRNHNDHPASFALTILGVFTVTLGAIPAALAASLFGREQLLEQIRFTRFSRLCQALWLDLTFYSFAVAHLVILLAVIWIPGGVGDQVVNWLAACSLDANLSWLPVAWPTQSMGLEPVVVPSSFDLPFYLKVAASAIFTSVFMPAIVSSSSFCTSFARRFRFTREAHIYAETFIEVLRQPTQKLCLKLASPWLHHAGTTLLWLTFCYALLFSFVAFTPGPLGEAILQSLDQWFFEAGFRALSVYDNPELRLFGASIVAMIGMVPLAVMSCSFLPTMKSKVISLSADGILLPRGPFLSLGFRPMRSWSDVRSVSIRQFVGETRPNKRTLIISFFSGGAIKLKLHQLSGKDLYDLLSAIDEHADDCVIAPEVLELRNCLFDEHGARALPEEGRLRNLAAENFRSTVFVPYEVGQTIPNTEMRVVRQLSTKPLSAVYLVRRADGKLAVVKQFCFPDGGADGASQTKMSSQVERMRKNFLSEYELLSGLDNCRIAKVLEVLELGSSNLLVLEFARGRDLRDIVERDGVRSETMVLELARQIVDVMSYLHSQSIPILHRDLTPDNLILDEERNLRLIDFGAAHQFLEGITGTLIGKQCYVAPEQLRGEPSIRSDIYSFGCTLYFLLTGEDPIALTQSDTGEESSVSRAMRTLILDCTQFDESARPGSFAEIRTRLDQIEDAASGVVSLEDPGHWLRLPDEDSLIAVSSGVDTSSSFRRGEGA